MGMPFHEEVNFYLKCRKAGYYYYYYLNYYLKQWTKTNKQTNKQDKKHEEPDISSLTFKL